MVCLYCKHKTRIINSRSQIRLNQVWRRRKCENCNAIFSTHEIIDYDATWTVKSSDKLIPFSKDKLYQSIFKCCQHRPHAIIETKELTNTVIGKLFKHSKHGLLTNQTIIEVTQVVLNRYDKTANMQYIAFHTH